MKQNCGIWICMNLIISNSLGLRWGYFCLNRCALEANLRNVTQINRDILKPTFKMRDVKNIPLFFVTCSLRRSSVALPIASQVVLWRDKMVALQLETRQNPIAWNFSEKYLQINSRLINFSCDQLKNWRNSRLFRVFLPLSLPHINTQYSTASSEFYRTKQNQMFLFQVKQGLLKLERFNN